MSVPKAKTQRSFFDVGFLAEDLFGPADPYRLFRERVLPALRGARERLAALYCEANGRPGIEPVVLAGVTLLQFMEQAPDRQAAERARLHLGWKFALDLAVGDRGFHATSLVRFRERLLADEAGRLVFDVIVAALREAGLAPRRSKQRLDSTHVLGLVSRLSRLEVVREAIRLTVEAMGRLAVRPAWSDWEAFVERYGAALGPGRDRTAAQWTALFVEAGRDAGRLAAWLDAASAQAAADGPLAAVDAHRAAGVLRRVFQEQYEVVEGQVTPRAKEGAGAVKNPHDPDAQWATKDGKGKPGWIGYKAQVMETAPETPEPKPKGEPTEAFITELVTTEAVASDLDGKERVETAQAAHGQERPPELFVDAAYVSGETLADAAAHGVELTGPARPPGKPKGGLGVEAFAIDVARRQATCPAGKTSTQCSFINDASQGARYYRFEWGAHCDACPLRSACTTSKSGRRIVCVGEHYDRLQARRREMQTEAFQQRMRQRAAIEGTISELVRLGLRRTRYRGLLKTTLCNYLTAAACNVRRWLRLEAWRLRVASAPTR